MKTTLRAGFIALLAFSLSGCFLTKVATVPMRLVGGGVSIVGDVVSVFPVVGNPADEAIERIDTVIDETADNIDKVPI